MPMKRLFFVSGFFFLFALSAVAQSQLMIQGQSGKLYLVHTVAAKENWYSVGRLYNISPREIAPFNGQTLEKPLSVGEQLKIPLTAVNFSQDGSRAADETFVPVYHTVQDKEWMFHISSTYNQVPAENIEKWNHLIKGQVKAGMQLVVGYLKVKPGQSALAVSGTDKVAIATAPTVVKKDETKPTVTEPAKTTAVKENTESKNTETVVDHNKPAENTVNTASYKPNTTSTVAGEGFFVSDFSGGGKKSGGQAGIFKSTSGWKDGKYYALMNNVSVGTIVKITNPSSSKSVYAKVLGQLPEMKESDGLTIRISNAAASSLGVADAKFPVEIRY